MWRSPSHRVRSTESRSDAKAVPPAFLDPMTTINGTYGFDSTFFTFTPDKTMTPPKIFGGNVGESRWPRPQLAPQRVG